MDKKTIELHGELVKRCEEKGINILILISDEKQIMVTARGKSRTLVATCMAESKKLREYIFDAQRAMIEAYVEPDE